MSWRAWPRPNHHPASKPTCRSRKPPSLTRRATTACVARPRRSVMRDLMAELKELRLHGMATAWAELTAQGESNTASSKWLLEHLQIGRASCRERVCQYV